jgi:hypothetical protein
MSYDDDLRALAASEGIEYVDCRVTPDWGSDQPVRHDHLRVVGPSQPRLKVGTVTAGVGLGDEVPAPAPPTFLRSPFEQLVLDPEYRKAADKGLRVHEDALALCEAEGISYDEAIKRVTA